jgi:hypothetical protein
MADNADQQIQKNYIHSWGHTLKDTQDLGGLCTDNGTERDGTTLCCCQVLFVYYYCCLWVGWTVAYKV